MYSITFPVRYYEADPMGVVHHSEYIRYFELARNRWLHDNGYTEEVSREDRIVFPVVHLECDYKRSARFGGLVTVTVEVESFTGARITVRQTVLDESGTLCAEGRVTLGFMKTDSGRVVRCPERLVEIINQKS